MQFITPSKYFIKSSILKFILVYLNFISFYLVAKTYQFKAENSQESLSDVLLTFDDIILELREDDFFYNVEDDSKDIELKEKSKINYQLEHGGNKESGEVNLNGSVIGIDVSSLKAKEKSKNLKQITKTRAKKAKSIPASKFNLSQNEARRIPGAGNDILRTVSALPGVQGTADANGEIYIRGSGKDDIYYSINSIRISNPFHTMGFYSAIPNILINNLNIYLGGFDSKFYNSQGGVIQIVTKKLKDYSARKINIESELSVAVASLNLNIPLLNNLRLNIGARRSYYEFWLGILQEIVNADREGDNKLDLTKVKPHFFDANLFLDWDINKYNQLKVFSIFADDGFLINLGEFPVINTITKTSDTGETEVTEKTNIVSLKVDTHEAWNVQGIEYNFNSLSGIKNTLSVYRYSITNNSSINKRQLSFFSRDQYALKDDFTFSFSKDFALSLGAFLNYEIAKISVFEHKDGKLQPRKENYGLGHNESLELIYKNPVLYTIFSLAQGDEAEDGITNNLTKFEDANEEYNNNLIEKKLSPKRFQASGYASVDFSLTEDLLIHAGVNSTYNTYSKKINVDPRINLSYFLLKQFTLSLKGGIYSQLPELYLKESFTVDPTEGLSIIQKLKLQQEDLETPHSYHLNFGVNTSLFNLFQLNFEGYYRYMDRQILANPTYDSKYDANTETNPRSINEGKGQAYGADIFIKQRIFKNTFGWLSYSWSKSLRYQYSDLDFAFVGDQEKNNGNDYKNLNKDWLPFARNVEHTLRVVYSLGITKNDTMGIRGELTSGLPYTPKVIDTRYTNELLNGTKDPVWSVREGKLYSKNYPMKWKLDLRYDRTIFKIGNAHLSFFIDIADIQTLIFTPTVEYVFSSDFLTDLNSGSEGRGPLKDFKDGDPVPDRYYLTKAEKDKEDGTTSVPDKLPLITLGLLFRY